MSGHYDAAAVRAASIMALPSSFALMGMGYSFPAGEVCPVTDW
jgi:hypothetical protein